MAEPKTFSFKVQAKPAGTVAASVLSARFGDGYEQRGADGIHSLKRSYQISVKAGNGCGTTTNEALEAKAFLEQTYGYISFLWSPPGEPTAYRFVCPGVQYVHEGNNVYTLTATFNQVHYP